MPIIGTLTSVVPVVTRDLAGCTRPRRAAQRPAQDLNQGEHAGLLDDAGTQALAWLPGHPSPSASLATVVRAVMDVLTTNLDGTKPAGAAATVGAVWGAAAVRGRRFVSHRGGKWQTVAFGRLSRFAWSGGQQGPS